MSTLAQKICQPHSYLPHSDDLIIWTDGTWCFRDDLPEYGHMSDDYHIISVHHPVYSYPAEQLAEAIRTIPYIAHITHA